MLLSLLLAACAHHGIRDAQALQLDTMAALARQTEAAAALREAAGMALAAGDRQACERFAAPALLIEATAQSQAYTALWLAGVPYPAEGELPARGTQPQPPASAPIENVSVVCGGAQ